MSEQGDHGNKLLGVSIPFRKASKKDWFFFISEHCTDLHAICFNVVSVSDLIQAIYKISHSFYKLENKEKLN